MEYLQYESNAHLSNCTSTTTARTSNSSSSSKRKRVSEITEDRRTEGYSQPARQRNQANARERDRTHR